MLKRLSPLQIIITFNDKYIVPHAYGALAVLREPHRCRASVEALGAANTGAGASAGMNGARVYFFSFSAAIARVAASITSLGARAMPSL